MIINFSAEIVLETDFGLDSEWVVFMTQLLVFLGPLVVFIIDKYKKKLET